MNDTNTTNTTDNVDNVQTVEPYGFERPSLEPYGKAYRLTKEWHTFCKGVLKQPFVVEEGFVTDGASIPKFLWSICGSPMDVPRVYAAIVHDRMYTSLTFIDMDGSGLKECTRAMADQAYRDYQIALGISKIKAYTQWAALRICGWTHWYKD